ncbi:MAG: exodeoxyribonuclease VII small subunit [Chloroflexi bacterium]|nr:exodeoxyribonuclease VII small subunit [Chloroflexota bacterium]
MAKSSSPKPVNELTYEAAFAELETIVAALESEQKSLDESMALYERGQALVKRCAELLDQAELKVKQLSGNELTDFEEAE